VLTARASEARDCPLALAARNRPKRIGTVPGENTDQAPANDPIAPMYKSATHAVLAALACASVSLVIAGGAVVAIGGTGHSFQGQIDVSPSAPTPPPGPRNGPGPELSTR
jgi:hypothetical protein